MDKTIIQTRTKAALHTLWQGGLGAGVVAALNHYVEIINAMPSTDAKLGLMILFSAVIGAVASYAKSTMVD